MPNEDNTVLRSPYFPIMTLSIMICMVSLGGIRVGTPNASTHSPKALVQHILDFQEPTGIRGTLRYMDLDEQILWLNWEERSDDRPWFYSGWKPVSGEALLAIHPLDHEQFTTLKTVATGTRLQLIIQEILKGKRQVLSWQPVPASPKTPI